MMENSKSSPESESRSALYLIAELSQGLGNQKLQLFGGILLAQIYKAALVEPEWRDWSYTDNQKSDAFESLYDFEVFARTALNVFGIQVVRRSEAFGATSGVPTKQSRVIVKRSHQCWDVWLWYERQMLKRGILDDRLLDFLNAFKLKEQHQALVNIILGRLALASPLSAWHALHMRTEKDWFKHSALIRKEIDLIVEEMPYVSPKSIRDKLIATFGRGQPHTLYLACDENAQHEDPFDIWPARTNTFHKRDIAALASCDNKTKSAIDFEICVESPVLIGSSRSSFFHLAGLTRFARSRNHATSWAGAIDSMETERPDYLYNLKSPRLAKRRDNGFFVAASYCIRAASVGRMDQNRLMKDLRLRVSLKLFEESCKTLVRKGARISGLKRPYKAVLSWAAARSNAGKSLLVLFCAGIDHWK